MFKRKCARFCLIASIKLQLNKGGKMYKETLFHGTNKDRSYEMIKTQTMLLSRGEYHWLGDGGYLFVEDLHAYKWIRDMFYSRYKKYPSSEAELSKSYFILQVYLKVSKNRVFDLTKSEHKILYDRVYKRLSLKRNIDSFAEGVVINYMFNELSGYKEKYDIVKALFTLNKNKYMDSRTRLGFMPQEQICIKNNNVVQAIKKYDFSERYERFNVLLKDYYFVDNILKRKTYTKRRRFGYRRKRK